MDDKYRLTRKENIFLARKRWDESIYCGMRMENRNVTFPQTKTILDGINVADVGLDDIQAILNMRDAWKYTLDHIDKDLDIDYLCKLQKRVAFREALAWGELRTGSVGISGVTYIPPIPDAKSAGKELAALQNRPGSKTELALKVFAWITRNQLFWDGNKRTALLAANKILIEHGAGILLVPDKCMVEFSTLLSSYYETGDSTSLLEFLFETSIFGIDSALSMEANASTTSGDNPKRTAAWLKESRKQQGITQKELANACGIATSTIANIEQGQRKGSKEVWVKLERYLGR